MTGRTASVAVVTYERPAFLARCLEHLLAQRSPPSEIIVVDSSESGETARLVADRFPSVRYEVNVAGRGATATARNIAYGLATGDVVAFVDDDAFAEPEWLERLMPAFDDPTVGAAGGRQIRGQPGERTEGLDEIGRFRDDGTLTGNFAADPGHPVDVDHLLGANMAFRRSVLDGLGGIRDGYEGTCIREETDLCLRVGAAGYRLVYLPDAVVEHVAAPYAKGERFDLRYAYWAQKNHLVLLARNFGPAAPVLRRYVATSLRDAVADAAERLGRVAARGRSRDVTGALRAAYGAVARTGIVLAATASGVWTGIVTERRDRRG